MSNPGKETGWVVHAVKPRLSLTPEPVRPAEVSEALSKAVLSPKGVLEDAAYNKIVPNRFIVEVDPENHARRFALIEPRLIGQWREKLLETLTTANSRQGRREYRFGGPVMLELRTAGDLAPGHARVLARIEPEAAEEPSLPYRLENPNGAERWPLRKGVVTIGRDPECEVHLADPVLQQKRLVSGQHAYLQCDESQVWIFDGTPGGSSSTNGTFVNGRRVPAGGTQLRHSDLIVLAALDPDHPDPNVPGSALLRFASTEEG